MTSKVFTDISMNNETEELKSCLCFFCSMLANSRPPRLKIEPVIMKSLTVQVNDHLISKVHIK